MAVDRPLDYSETLIVGDAYQIGTPLDGERREILRLPADSLQGLTEIRGRFRSIVFNIADFTPDMITDYAPIQPGIEYIVVQSNTDGTVEFQTIEESLLRP